ncbi:nucleotidyltransferase domain-containing protein [Paractinoplanes lichenicola]|uniref:Nucleotidyltransferase domain-containing protein n=1 Tax=Paractinoplanes lichenicola TaxID=2802976 RepID=A0ABS1W5I2_9ACTN|nr:nucleotidyltransferase domain-containing protein [Actinoplanes lichenicola]MBL7261957.1 nucleotidyltransferase domain-containing protein [Actinoplanes lichenicola]
MHSERWRELKEDRLHEAITVLGRVPGVRGFLIGGSLGRGEPWPLSDIDLLPVYDDPEADLPVRQGQLEMVDWWAGSGLAQSLDLSWLSFTTDEIRSAMTAGPEALAGTIAEDRKWFHGIDKAYGSRPSDPSEELTAGFANWLTSARFHPSVVTARIAEWRRQALTAADTAQKSTDPAAATLHLRESARAVRMMVLEGWGERLGSMGREWTRFERMADKHGHRELADRLAVLAGADVPAASRRAEIAPLWLRERITLCWQARQAIGEPVTAAQNARDQVAAYLVHVSRHRPDLDGPWTGTPDPDLAAHLEDLRHVIDELAGGV